MRFEPTEGAQPPHADPRRVSVENLSGNEAEFLTRQALQASALTSDLTNSFSVWRQWEQKAPRDVAEKRARALLLTPMEGRTGKRPGSALCADFPANKSSRSTELAERHLSDYGAYDLPQ